MKWPSKLFYAACLMFLSFRASATVRYVDVNCATPATPYTSWATAATNIQDAISASSFTGDTVLVTNGLYQSGSYLAAGAAGGNRVNLNKTITVQSVNGPAVTTILGYQVPGTTNGTSAIRCVYLANGATLSGFTLTNGATVSGETGGGVKCQSVVNCVITNCTITANAAASGGGGVYSGTVLNSVISGNATMSSWGGGAYFSTLTNCLLLGNSAASSGSGSGGGLANGTAVNCVLAGNWCGYIYGAAITSTLINCTVVSNRSGAYGGPLGNCTLKNCIDYYNFAYNTTPDSGSGNFTNCCAFPAQASGANNVTNPPSFINLAGGDFHLQPNSPCINAGNNSFIPVTNDLDGNPRVVGLTVDIGAYEFQYQTTGSFYVSISNAQPVFPFQTWDTATTNLQDAIDAASSGSQILVSNGVYRTGGRVVYGSLTNRVVVNRSLIVQSVNGAAVTFIEGFQMPGATNGNNAIRCIYLTNGVVLDGFTLTNGATRSTGVVSNEQSGGGIWCESTNVFIRNCVLIRNAAYNSGGGIYSGTLTNCTMIDNQLGSGGGSGGGADFSVLDHCTLSRNRTGSTAGASGGGAASSLLNNCLVSSNVSVYPGGGVASSTLNACRLIGNSTTFYEGGGAASSTLNNCLVISNSTPLNGGGTSLCTLTNCTVVGNSAGQRGGGTYAGTLYNCIVYYNTELVQGSNYNNYYSSVFGNTCCTIPAPGAGVITNLPVFEVFSPNFRLQPYSPCINNGDNASAASGTDLDGNPRIVGGTVDIGAYEHPHPGLVLPYFWAQQYGLPTYGYYDSDGDGLNNWQEWIAGTNPTNAASVLAMNSVAYDASGPTVTWQSVSGVTYYLQSSTDLSAEPAFTSIQSNLVGQAGTTSYKDTTATNGSSYFYRVGVQ